MVSMDLKASQVIVDFDLDSINHCEVICVDLHSQPDYRICLCYRPPGYVTVSETLSLFKYLRVLCCSTDRTVIVLGEFNLPGVDWTTLSGLPEGCSDLILESLLTQLVSFPTMTSFGSTNINDLVFATDPQYVISMNRSQPFLGSVHHSVEFELFAEPKGLTKLPSAGSTQVYNYFRANYTGINTMLLTLNWEDFYRMTDLTAAYDCFCKTIMEVVHNNCPLRVTRIKPKRRFPMGMKSLYRKKRIMYRNISSALDMTNYKNFAKSCAKKVSDFYDDMEMNAIESKGKFFDYLRSRLKPKEDIIAMETSDGSVTLDKKEIAELFADNFASVYKEPIEAVSMDQTQFNRSDEITLDKFEVSEDLVHGELRRLSHKTTRSADGVPPIVLAKCATALTKPITYLLELSFSQGVIPDKWRHILVQPIHKKGNKRLVTNYRPIGLTSILSKISERIMKPQLVTHLTNMGFTSDKQHGFRVGRSTITSLLQTQTEWKELLQDNECIYVLYLDFSKAFDVVDHSILRNKLNNSRIRGSAMSWLSDYLSRRTMSVLLEDECSTSRMVHSGVIQGSAAGPALFSFLAHDLPSCLDDPSKSNLFADDVKLFAVSKDKLEMEGGKVVNWSKTNRLPLAPGKSILIKIRRRRTKVVPESIVIDGVTVHSSLTVKDLGILINDDLECHSHIKNISTKAFRMSNLILRILKTRKIELFKKAFYSLVIPILEYGCVVWCPTYAKDINLIEKVQRRFTKRAQYKCGKRPENYSKRLAIWKIPTLESRRLQCDLVWVYKIVYGYVELDREQFFRIVQNSEEIKIYPKPLKSTVRNNTQVNTLAYRSYKCWNALPTELRKSVSVASFKYKLKNYDLSKFCDSKIKW
jgi:ribonucleases P/MRP protein subunit RPP40